MILRIAKRVFLLIALAFLVYFAWQSRDMLAEIIRAAKFSSLVFAALIWLSLNAFAAVFSAQVFRVRGIPMSYQTAMRIHVANLPGRYVPGGIWHTVGRAASFREMGVAARDISIFIFLENVLAICLAFILGGAFLATTRGFEGWGQLAVLSAMGGAVLLLVAPFILSARVIKDNGKFPIRNYAMLTIVTALSWCAAAFAFVTYLSAFPELATHIVPLEIAGSYLFSWGIGFISIFAPQGIGVFEVVAADLLRGVEPLMGIAAVIAGFRLIILAADAVAWLVLQLLSGLAVGQRRNLL